LDRVDEINFYWVVGIPEQVRTESYFHVRYASERGGDEKTSQPIFHRPASSGVYASVATFELARIGFNDISQRYAIEEDERLRRYRAFLRSVTYTYVEPNGAMRGTQNPHILGFSGTVAVSHNVLPAPTISPLAEDYVDQIRAVANSLSDDGEVKVYEFGSMAEFTEIMRNLIEGTRPYRLFGEEGG